MSGAPSSGSQPSRGLDGVGLSAEAGVSPSPRGDAAVSLVDRGARTESPEAPVLLLSGGRLVGSLGISRTSGPDALPYSKHIQIKDSEVRNRSSTGVGLGDVARCRSDVAVSKPAFWLDV